MKGAKIKPGAFLYADPLLHDAYFGRSVIVLASHDEQGSVGFIVNKKLQVTLNDILPEPLSTDFEVFYGGPVNTDSLHYLHTLESVPDAIQVNKNLYWGGDFGYISDMVDMGTIQMGQIKFFVGYAGWGNGQLDEEMNTKSWVVGNEPPKIIFDEEKCLESWKDKMNALGSKYSVWANFPQNPSMN